MCFTLFVESRSVQHCLLSETSSAWNDLICHYRVTAGWVFHNSLCFKVAKDELAGHVTHFGPEPPAAMYVHFKTERCKTMKKEKCDTAVTGKHVWNPQCLLCVRALTSNIESAVEQQTWSLHNSVLGFIHHKGDSSDSLLRAGDDNLTLTWGKCYDLQRVLCYLWTVCELRRQARQLGVPVAVLSVKMILERLMEITGTEEEEQEDEKRELLTSSQRVSIWQEDLMWHFFVA